MTANRKSGSFKISRKKTKKSQHQIYISDAGFFDGGYFAISAPLVTALLPTPCDTPCLFLTSLPAHAVVARC
jgi:hypothetical protein